MKHWFVNVKYAYRKKPHAEKIFPPQSKIETKIASVHETSVLINKHHINTLRKTELVQSVAIIVGLNPDLECTNLTIGQLVSKRNKHVHMTKAFRT